MVKVNKVRPHIRNRTPVIYCNYVGVYTAHRQRKTSEVTINLSDFTLMHWLSSCSSAYVFPIRKCEESEAALWMDSFPLLSFPRGDMSENNELPTEMSGEKVKQVLPSALYRKPAVRREDGDETRGETTVRCHPNVSGNLEAKHKTMVFHLAEGERLAYKMHKYLGGSINSFYVEALTSVLLFILLF